MKRGLDDPEGGSDVDASQLAIDAMQYVGGITPLLLLIGGISFADIMIHFLINLFKELKGKKVKW